jgi:AcrR family transcriptional regulator
MSVLPVTEERAPYAVAARNLLRETLFTAARDQLQLRPWSEITMADIAGAAGVSRQTLYKNFGSRNEFALALVIQEGERFLNTVESAVREHTDDPSSAVSAGLQAFLSTAAEDPLVEVLLSDDGTSGTLPFLTTRGLPVLQWAAARLAQVMHEGWPEGDLSDAQLLAESLVRLAISYLTAPNDTPRAMADAAGRLLGPFADRALSKSLRGA